MKEVKGDMWSYLGRKKFVILVTTNGYIKKNGEGVMGAGCAAQAAEQFPDLPRLLGKSLKARGNVLSKLMPDIWSFPVKHDWFDKADLKLIRKSVKALQAYAEKMVDVKFILPRPGCGNGQRKWSEVKKLVKDLPDNVFVISKE